MKLSTGVRSIFSTLILAGLVLGMQACGGGGLAAPAIVNASAQSYVEATTITTLSFTNSGGGSISSCSASPTLPDGLSITVSSNSSTCEISGTATTPQAASDYTVTATNATGNNTATVSITVTVIADQDATGYFTGSAAVKTDGDNNVDFAVSDLQIMISGTRIMMMSDEQALLYDGTFTIAGNDLTSTVTIYHNGNVKGTAVLNATVLEGSQITGSFTGTELGNGTFVSTFSLLNGTPAAVAQVGNNNNWLSNLNEGTSNFEFQSVINSGVLEVSDQTIASDSDFAGCGTAPDGTFTPIAGTSLFSVTIPFVNCTSNLVDGMYTGFAQMKTATTFALTVSNGTYAFADDFVQN